MRSTILNYKVIWSFNKTLPYRQWPNEAARASHLSTSPKNNDFAPIEAPMRRVEIQEACVKR